MRFGLFGGKRGAPGDGPLAVVGAVGKVPAESEYLTAPSAAEPLASLERWMDGGVEHARSAVGRPWDAAFDRCTPQAFLWPGAAGSARALCGVLCPSVDLAGRRYPLAVYASVPLSFVAKAAHAVPLAFGDFLSGALDLIRLAMGPGGGEILRARLGTLAPPSAASMAAAVDEYATWAEQTPCEQVWPTLFGGTSPYEDALRSVGALVEAVGPPRPTPAAPPPVVAFPLGAGGAAAAALWLDVLQRTRGPGAGLPAAFWDVDAGRMTAFTGAPAPTEGFLLLWAADGGGAPGPLRLALPPPRSDGSTEPRLSARVLHVLGQPTPRMAALLGALHP